MVIVTGWLRVAEGDRDRYLETCRAVVEQARATPGCIDFSISADLVDHERINIVEQWETLAAVEAFRGEGTSDDQQELIIDALVEQHEIASTIGLT
jgi:quinol monooxygenase YgiN